MTPTSRRRATARPSPRRVAPRASRAVRIGTLPLAGSTRGHPEIGLGLWGLGRWRPDDEARTRATIARAWEQGLRWFDTAEVYGNGRSERLLGEVLHRSVRGGPDAFVATKVSWEHLRPSQVRAALIGSLERLARPSVDLYLVHGPDPHVALSETMGALEELYREHRVGAIGVSNFSVEELEEAGRHLSEARIAVNQVEYNLFNRDEGDSVREYCARHEILVEAYTPLARGLLHGRYLDGRRVPPEVRRMAHRVFEDDRLPEILLRTRRLRDLANEAGVPLASLALHWLRRRGAAPIVGMSRPEQVDTNLAAWAARPPAAVLDRADAIARGADA